MSARLCFVSLLCTLLVGMGLGYVLRGSRAPSPTVQAAEAVARGKTAEAHAAVAIAKPANAAALTALAQYHARRQRDTVVVDSIVYVPAAAADTLANRCTDAIAKDTAALAKQDTALAAVHTVVEALTAAQAARLGGAVTGLYDPRQHTALARADVAVRITSRWAVVGEAERGMLPRDSLQLRAGVRWSF